MPSPDTSSLFRPFTIRSLELKNRIVMAPMTRLFAPEGVPGPASADYYRRRAEGRAGLILSEGTVIDRPASRNDSGIPFFHGDAALQGWKNVIDAVHNAGGRMGPQIWHTGATRYINGWEPDAPVESPSGLDAPGDARGVAMTEEDIADTVAAFAKAAAWFRHCRDPRRARLPDRSILLGRHQSTDRPLRRAHDQGALTLCKRDRQRRA